jgi:hypothetical protein
MTKEVKQFITQQKKIFIKINKAALDDINKVSIDYHLALYTWLLLTRLFFCRSWTKVPARKEATKERYNVY